MEALSGSTSFVSDSDSETDDAAAFVEANVFASRAIGSNGSVSHGGDRCPRDARRRADDQKLRGSLGDANASKRVKRRLGGVVTCGTYPSQVRFGDWTLDAFRVQSLRKNPLVFHGPPFGRFLNRMGPQKGSQIKLESIKN